MVASIGQGLLVLLGRGPRDGARRADPLAAKVRALRVFPDADGEMNQPLEERDVLAVNQFTLARTRAAATARATTTPPPGAGGRAPLRASAIKSALRAGASAPTWRSSWSTMVP